ncbi:MAG TPA: response regulator [Methylomirabilota bacterium]|jgi:DNA-binding response OmpR family regulator|nr:response regulator [Methylomirabilota bacterium]
MSNRSKKILIVEDDPSISELIKTILDDQGFTTYTCLDGKGVLKMAKELMPNVILLDLQIPGVTGENVTRLIKNNRETAHIPVIIISAQNNLAATVRKIRADDSIGKPFDLDHLVGIVNKYAN